MPDSFMTNLATIFREMEDVYLTPFGLDSSVSIVKILETVGSQKSKLDGDQKVKMNNQIGELSVGLSYLVFRMKFYSIKKLDFSLIPALDEVTKILIQFTDNESVTKDNVKKLNGIVQLMAELDARNNKARLGLGYRAIRLSLLMILLESYANASIMITLVLEQICLI